jgi:hypothetical protein
MSQQILFKRGAEIFNNRAVAISKLNELTWTAGEPVIASYKDENSGINKILFAIGIGAGTGSLYYRLIADSESLNEALLALQSISEALSGHVDDLASGENAGHVINDETADIEFVNGIGKLKKGNLAIDALAKSAAAGIIGYKSSAVSSGDASAEVLTWNDVMAELQEAGLKTYRTIKMGKASDPDNMVSVSSNSLGGTLSITTDDNISVSSPGENQLHISLAADLSEVGSNLTTLENQPIVLTGTTTGISTAFNPNGVALPGGSTAVTIAPDSPIDTESSDLIATVGYVSQKINKVLESNDAMHYMGSLDPTSAEFKLPAGNAGDTYKISKDGSIEGLGNVHAGDMIICSADNTAEQTASNWDLVEVHDGSLISPEGASAGNIVAFGNGNEVIDTNINYQNIVTSSRGIVAGTGLSGGGNLAGDVTISHENISAAIEGEGSLVTGIEVNEQGHVTKIVKGNIDNSLTLAKEGSWSDGAYANAGYTINGIALSNGVLTAYASELPGTVRANNGTQLKYLKDVIAGKAENLVANEYAVSTSLNGDVVELSVKIDKIDGGTF